MEYKKGKPANNDIGNLQSEVEGSGNNEGMRTVEQE